MAKSNHGTKISLDVVQHLAKLANLPLTKEEEVDLQSSLSSIIKYVGEVKSLEIAGLPTTNQVTGKVNELRDDIVEPSLSLQEATSQASVPLYKNYFLVPKILHDD